MESIINEILELVKKKMREQGAYDRDAFNYYIDETIEYFKEKGKLTDEDDTEFIAERVEEMWSQVEEKMTD